jgi:acetoin utilization deacetylase AcuC-like enzyme
MVAASYTALIDGIACSPSSGFHHAGYDHNGAFCTFNGLIVAAQRTLQSAAVEVVGIIDCDAHYGDGTDDIIENLKLHSKVVHWTFGKYFRLGSFQQRDLISSLNATLDAMKRSGVGLILFQAGADPHIDDPLGGFMTSAEMRERDSVVLRKCRDLALPVVINLAGGYQFDSNGTIGPVLALHRATIEEALRLFP